MLTLLLDTSGPFTTSALMRSDDMLAISALRGRPAALMHDQIRVMMHSTGVALSELSRIVIVIGPGSWTGLNIGVTAAKTLAQVLHLKVLPISSLDALAASHPWNSGPVCALLSAGRSRVYRTWYAASSNGRICLTGQKTAVIPVATLDEEAASSSGSPLLVEYGCKVGPTITARCTQAYAQRLEAEAMARVASQTEPLSSAEVRKLTPAYLQMTLAERDLAQ